MSDWPPMERRGPQVTTEDVCTFEDRFGFALPEDYRTFLLQVNGGRTADTHAAFSEGVVNKLLSLREEVHEARDLLTRAERARKDLPVPSLLFIGSDEGGARLLLALDGDHRGEVWLQVTTDARPPDANPRVLWHDRRDFTKIADSFSAFMASLGPLP